MATVLERSEQRVLLEGVSWEIFESLAQGALVERDESAALPGVTAELVARLLSAGRALDRLTWLRQVRTSVRGLPEVRA